MSLVQRERDTYSELWEGVPSYSAVTVGDSTVKMFQDMSGAKSGHVLDAGCGTGQGGLILKEHGFAVTLLDFTPSGLSDAAKTLPFQEKCLWDDLRPEVKVKNLYSTYDRLPGTYDYVFCTDVLEHIPTEYAMLVIRRLLDASKMGVFLTISLIPDNQGVWVGKTLHQTVQPFVWWRDRIKTLGTLKECRDLLIKGAYYVTC